MVELVDDDDVERVGSQAVELGAAERLDHREHVPARRDLAAAVLLAERAVLEHGAVGSHRLLEDLVAVRDEQEGEVGARAREQLLVVERGDHGLAGPGRRDHEVAVPPVALAFERERVEHPLLVRVGAHVEARNLHGGGLTERPAVVLA